MHEFQPQVKIHYRLLDQVVEKASQCKSLKLKECGSEWDGHSAPVFEIITAECPTDMCCFSVRYTSDRHASVVVHNNQATQQNQRN